MNNIMSNIERKTWGNISKIINLLLLCQGKYNVWFDYHGHVDKFGFHICPKDSFDKLIFREFYLDAYDNSVEALKKVRNFYTANVMNDVFVSIDGKEVGNGQE